MDVVVLLAVLSGWTSRRAPAAASWKPRLPFLVIRKPTTTRRWKPATCPRTDPLVVDGCALLPAAAGPATQAYAASLCYSCGRDSKLRSCHHEAHAHTARLEERKGMQGCPYEQMALARRGKPFVWLLPLPLPRLIESFRPMQASAAAASHPEPSLNRQAHYPLSRRRGALRSRTR